jgi:hypothetical protein
MKYYLWLILFFAMVGITWAGGPIGPEQYAPPQDVLVPIDDGLTIAQIFYYVAGGGAAVAVAVKTWLTVYRRWKNKKNV